MDRLVLHTVKDGQLVKLGSFTERFRSAASHEGRIYAFETGGNTYRVRNIAEVVAVAKPRKART